MRQTTPSIRKNINLCAIFSLFVIVVFLSPLSIAQNDAVSHSSPDRAQISDKILQLSSNNDSYSLYGYMKRLPTSSSDQTFEQTLQAFQKQKFMPVQGFLNLGYTLETSWVSFVIKAPDNLTENYILWLSPYMLNFVDVYVQEGQDATNPAHYRHHAAGDNHPVSLQAVRHSRHLVPLSLRQGQQHRIFIRTQTTSSHVLRAWVRTETETLSESNTHIIWLAAFIACALLLGTIALLQAIRLKSRIQFWYGCYLLSESCTQLGMQGFLPLLLPDQAHHIADWLTGSGVAGIYLSLSCIIMHILNTRQDHPFFHRYLCLLSAVAALTFPLTSTDGYIPIQYILVPMGLLIMPVSTLLYFRKHPTFDRSQRLFFLFFLICSLGISVHLLRLSGFLPVNELTFGAMMLIAVLHMLLLNLALSEKLLDAEQRARHAAQQSESQAIAIAREMTRELMESKQHLEIALNQEQQALEEQSRFIDMISHEYRTPLAIIRTNLDILDIKQPSEWQGKHNIQAIFQATERLKEVFETQLRQGSLNYQIIPRKRSDNAVHTISNIMEDACSLWSEYPIQFTLPEQRTVILNADSALLKTLIFNLIDNAIKYSPNDSPVFCRLDSDDHQLRFTVSNTIADAENICVEQLCDKYVRGSNSSGRSGLGLGLYLVKRITELHDGDLDITVQQGDLFSVQLSFPVYSETKVSQTDNIT